MNDCARITLATALLLSTLACEDNLPTGPENQEPEPGLSAEFDVETLTIGFRPVSFDPNVPDRELSRVKLLEGESVTFENTSRSGLFLASGESFTEEARNVSWVFEAGDPGTSTEQSPTVQYREAGLYDVTIRAEAVVQRQFFSDERIRSDFILVIPNPDYSEYLLSEERGSDGTETRVTWDERLPRATGVDRKRDGALVEATDREYRDENTNNLETERYYDGDGSLMGTREFSYRTFGPRFTGIISESIGGSTGPRTELIYRYRERADAEGFFYVDNATLTQTDGEGGSQQLTVRYTYDADFRNVLEEAYFSGDQLVGRIVYEFDNAPNIFRSLKLQTFPERYNGNNPTRKTTFDGAGNVVEQLDWSYTYGPEVGNRPTSATRTTNGGSPVTWEYSYVGRSTFTF